MFERQGGEWQQTAKLTPSDGGAFDEFGYPVRFTGKTALIGAWRDDDGGEDSGSAYVFEKVAGVWTQMAKLTAGDGEAGDAFGIALSICSDTALIGADWDDDNGVDSGSVYLFERTDGAWNQTAKLTAGDGTRADWFGCSVDLLGDTAVVGARRDDENGSQSGSAYVFKRIGGSWNQTSKLTASDGASEDGFGLSVGLSGDAVLIGAEGVDGEDSEDENIGSAYMFELECLACPADLDGSGAVDFEDLLRVLDAWGNAGGPEDLDSSGIVDFGDLLIVLDAWGPCE